MQGALDIEPDTSVLNAKRFAETTTQSFRSSPRHGTVRMDDLNLSSLKMKSKLEGGEGSSIMRKKRGGGKVKVIENELSVRIKDIRRYRKL